MGEFRCFPQFLTDRTNTNAILIINVPQSLRDWSVGNIGASRKCCGTHSKWVNKSTVS